MIWNGGFPPRKPRRHTLIEKLVCTVAILFSFLSVSRLKAVFKQGSPASHLFMDVYVLFWATLLSCTLFFGAALPRRLVIFVAIYRLVDIIDYRILFLFVKSQERPWTSDLLRRSVAIVLLNFFEAVVAFAILCLRTGASFQSSVGNGVTDPWTALYFSFVTMLTVGYGDIVPASVLARGIVICQLTTTVLFIIVLVPALVSVFSPALKGQQD